MDVAAPSDTESVMILKADKIYAQTLHHVASTALNISDVRLAVSVSEAAEALANRPTDLLIAGVESSIQGNVLDFLATCLGKRRLARRALVLITYSEFRLLSALRTLCVHGVFDSAHEDPRCFTTVLKGVAGGARYWSPTTAELPPHQVRHPDSLFGILTLFEQIVLSVVGDGSDDVTAARELNLSPATISTVRRHLHRKLGVQHRGELVRVAAQNGFVRFTPAGVIRPGFGLLTTLYRARKRKPVHRTSAPASPS